jgi:hypothetical protein
MADPYDVISDATKALYALLQAGMAPGKALNGLGLLDVALPSETYEPASKPALTLCLYRVVENTHGRNRERIRVPTSTPDDPARFAQTEPPMLLDLHYLLVPFAESHLKEQEWLGRTVQYLYDNRVVPSTYVTGFLAEQEAEITLQLETGQDFSFENLARLWEVFGRKYKVALSYKMRGVHVESTALATHLRVLEAATDLSPT